MEAMEERRRIFKLDANVTTTVALIVSILVGLAFQDVNMGVQTFLVTLVTSGLNIDNVLVLIPIVRNMPKPWQIAFLSVGMMISVVGVMLAAPTWFLAMITQVSFGQAANLAMFHGGQFSDVLDHQVSQFIQLGAMTFLGLLAVSELVNADKIHHWLPFEARLVKLANWWGSAGDLIVLVPAFLTAMLAPTTNRAIMMGVPLGTYIAFKIFHHLNKKLTEKAESASTKRWHDPLMWFVFGCTLEGIFSIDGLAGAFAVTHDMRPIAFGAVTGTLIMRLLTMKLSKINIMERFKFLDQALFWAILALAILSGLAVWSIDLPNVVSAVLPMVIIFGGGYHSHRKNKQVEAV